MAAQRPAGHGVSLPPSAVTDCAGTAAATPAPPTIDAAAHASPFDGAQALAPATIDAAAPASPFGGSQASELAAIDAAVLASPLEDETALRVHVDDQGGMREVIVPGFIPGRRYSIGKDRSSDIVVEGTYTSRRHCELWVEQGSGWIVDLGSTNGTRIELGGRVLAVSGGCRASSESQPLRAEVAAGADIVLSAAARGPACDYPRIRLVRGSTAAHLATPRAPIGISQQTPVPSIVPPAAAASRYIVEATTGEGVRAIPLEKSRLPWSVGRSRRSSMVVPRIHEGVSGHHIDIVALDEQGAEVLVHGDNGLRQGMTAYGAGERFHWRVGEVLEFGRASAQEPVFALKLFQHASSTVRE